MSERGRESGAEYCVQILVVNGIVRDDLSHKSIYLENISKGGFRFVSNIVLEDEDRVQVLLRFPDDNTKEVLGRICYSNEHDGENRAYGISVLDGFYSLPAKSAGK